MKRCQEDEGFRTQDFSSFIPHPSSFLLADGQFPKPGRGSHHQVRVMFHRDVHELGGNLLLVNPDRFAADAGRPEPLGVAGIILHQRILAEEFQHQIVHNLGFRAGTGGIPLLADHHPVHLQERGDLIGVEHGAGESARRVLGAVRKPALVPGGVAIEHPIRAQTGSVRARDQVRADILVGILPGRGVPRLGGVGGGGAHGGDAPAQIIAQDALGQPGHVQFAPVGSDLIIEVNPNGKPLVQRLFIRRGPGEFHSFEIRANGADIIGFRIEGFGVHRLLVFKPPAHLDGGKQKIQGLLDIAGIPPAEGVGGERFREKSLGEPGFVGQANDAWRVQAGSRVERVAFGGRECGDNFGMFHVFHFFDLGFPVPAACAAGNEEKG